MVAYVTMLFHIQKWIVSNYDFIFFYKAKVVRRQTGRGITEGLWVLKLSFLPLFLLLRHSIVKKDATSVQISETRKLIWFCSFFWYLDESEQAFQQSDNRSLAVSPWSMRKTMSQFLKLWDWLKNIRLFFFSCYSCIYLETIRILCVQLWFSEMSGSGLLRKFIFFSQKE